LAHAHILALDSLLSGGPSNQFNAGTGTGYSVRELIAAVEKVTGKKVPFVVGPRRDGDPAELVANSDKLKRTLQWTPVRSSLEDIVASAWQFQQSC
jgi:UDP-glucose 4-epimerase